MKKLNDEEKGTVAAEDCGQKPTPGLDAGPSLLPCPFCGGVAAWAEGEQKEKYGNEQVYCTVCYALTPPEGDKAAAAEWWNRRTDSPVAVTSFPDSIRDDIAHLALVAERDALRAATFNALQYVEAQINPSWSKETLSKMLKMRHQLREALKPKPDTAQAGNSNNS